MSINRFFNLITFNYFKFSAWWIFFPCTIAFFIILGLIATIYQKRFSRQQRRNANLLIRRPENIYTIPSSVPVSYPANGILKYFFFLLFNESILFFFKNHIHIMQKQLSMIYLHLMIMLQESIKLNLFPFKVSLEKLV